MHFSTATNNSVSVPVATYSNADTQKKQILKDNKGKSGVYRWTNLLNAKSYIGSGVNLSKRLSYYYSRQYMKTKLKRSKSLIYSSILIHGLSNFKLEILEYCEPRYVISREQYFLDLLKPKYNILPTAGSNLGFKHSEETKALISEAQQGENNSFFGQTFSHSEETKAKISEAQQGENNSFFGQTHSYETKAKISEALGTAIKVLDKETNATSTYASIRKAAEALGVTQRTLCYHFKKTNSFIFKGRYRIEKVINDS